jgi:hypothetical protein
VDIIFGKNSASSIRLVKLTTSIGEIEFYIIDIKIFFLFSFNNINRFKVYSNNLENALITRDGRISLIR